MKFTRKIRILTLIIITLVSWQKLFLWPCFLTPPQSALLTTPPLFSSQVFNKAAFQAKSARELIDAVADFMDCSIVIPPTEIQNEAVLTSLISFQQKLLQDRVQAPDPTPCLESKPRRGECNCDATEAQLTVSYYQILFSSSLHFFRVFTWRPSVPYWPTIRRDASRHKEALPILQEWHDRCTKLPGSRCRHLHLLRRPVSCHHLRRAAG